MIRSIFVGFASLGELQADEAGKRGASHSTTRTVRRGHLFIAGSFVFPTGDYDMPTLTIVAFAHRLADHLHTCPAPKTDVSSSLRMIDWGAPPRRHLCVGFWVLTDSMHGAHCGGEAAIDERPLAFFIQDLRAGGAERNVTRILNGIVARGIRTDLVVVQKKGVFFDELDPRIRVVELSRDRTIKSVLALKRYIETVRPTALVSSLTHTNIAAILGNLLAATKTRLIVIERNHFSLNRRIKHGLVWLAYMSAPFLYPRADAVAAVSGGVRDDLARAIGVDAEKIAVLYNPVVSDNIERLASQPVEHPWLNDKDVPVILGVGRLERQKNFRLLIEAFDRVRRVRRARLMILGEGELRPDLERLVRQLEVHDLVDLPGFDANPFRYMQRASLFVMPSDWEGLPTVLIEAMACGVPVVSTDCPGGPREVLVQGVFGRLVPTGDADALAAAILATLDQPGDRTTRIARAHEFSLMAAVDRYLDLIGRIDPPQESRSAASAVDAPRASNTLTRGQPQ